MKIRNYYGLVVSLLDFGEEILNLRYLFWNYSLMNNSAQDKLINLGYKMYP